MKLIFSNNTIGGILSYQIGDGSEYIAYKDIVRDISLQYRLAISMYSGGTGLQLTEFDSYPTLTV